MIYQENLIGTIIGSAFTTGFAILVWYIIEKIKYLQSKRKDVRNFNNLYNLFEKKKIEPFFSIEITNLIDEIGTIKIQQVLKMTYQHHIHKFGIPDYSFENLLFLLEVFFREGNNLVVITEDTKSFNYGMEDNNIDVKDRFLKYFREKCEKEKIKIE